MTFNFVHAGDLLLDTPFRGPGRVPAPIAEAIRDASLDALGGLVALTVQRRAAFLLVSGHLHDSRGLGLRAQVRLRDGLERLAGEGIPVVLVRERSDPPDWPALGEWPANVSIVVPGGVVVVRGDGGAPLAHVHGPAPSAVAGREGRADSPRRGPEPGLHIGIVRCQAAGGNGEGQLDLDAPRSAGLDYWAVRREGPRGGPPDPDAAGPCEPGTLRERDPWIVDPGIVQERCAPATTGGSLARGALAVAVGDGGVTGLDLVALDRIRAVTALGTLPGDLPAGEGDTEACAHERLQQRLEGLRRENPDSILIVRGVVSGQARGSVAELLRELRSESEGFRPHVWWERIEVDPWPGLERKEILRRDDFSADVVRLAGRYESDAAELTAFFDGRTRELESQGVDETLVPLGASARVELLRQAEKKALRRLEEESQA